MSRDVIREAGPDVQAMCEHARCGWAVLDLDTTDSRARGPIRWTCLDCGRRTGNSQPYADHPDHERYTRVIDYDREATLPLF